MKSRTRTALLSVVLVGCISGAAGAAFSIGGDDDTESGHIPTRAEVYTEGMNLEEIAKAASGLPGEIAPACPDEMTVHALKDAGIKFGPCDPAPEEGQPVRLPAADDEEPGNDPKEVCPGTILGKGVDLTIQLPCAVGAEIVDANAVKNGDTYCAEVSYIEKAGAAERTETLCEGDVPAIGGPPVTGPKAASTEEQEDGDGHTHEH